LRTDFVTDKIRINTEIFTAHLKYALSIYSAFEPKFYDSKSCQSP